MGTKLRSRWDKPPPVGKCVESDLDICKLLAPGAFAHDPWGYHCLPSSYFGQLLTRPLRPAADRVSALRGDPRYTKLSEQAHDIYRQMIFQIDKAGVEQVQDAGFTIKLRSRAIPHELMACCIAASIEVGIRKHGLPISIHPHVRLPTEPDWPLFTLSNRTVFVEADTGSETINPLSESQAENIRRKINHYLEVVEGKLVRRPLFLFITTSPRRALSMIDLLKHVIDKRDLPHRYAEPFAFGSIKYDRFLNFIPPLTPWAVETEYQRAGHAPFSFIERTEAADGRETRTDTRTHRPEGSNRLGA